jgi:hypothetical protein
MAIALVQTAVLGAIGSGASQQTGAFAAQPTVGNYLLAWAWGWNGQGGTIGFSAFSDTGANAYTVPANAKQGINNDLWCAVGYAKVATAGASFKVTATATATGGSVMVVASEFSGVLAASPVDGAAVGITGTTGIPAPGSLAFTAGDLVVAVMARDATTYLGSTPTGFTRAAFQNDGTNFQVGEALYAIGPASPTNPAWATSTTSWGTAQFALKAAAGGGAAAFVARRPYALGQAVPRAAFY